MVVDTPGQEQGTTSSRGDLDSVFHTFLRRDAAGEQQVAARIGPRAEGDTLDGDAIVDDAINATGSGVGGGAGVGDGREARRAQWRIWRREPAQHVIYRGIERGQVERVDDGQRLQIGVGEGGPVVGVGMQQVMHACVGRGGDGAEGSCEGVRGEERRGVRGQQVRVCAVAIA